MSKTKFSHFEGARGDKNQMFHTLFSSQLDTYKSCDLSTK